MAGEWDANQAWHLTNISLRYACLEAIATRENPQWLQHWYQRRAGS